MSVKKYISISVSCIFVFSRMRYHDERRKLCLFYSETLDNTSSKFSERKHGMVFFSANLDSPFARGCYQDERRSK